MKDDDLDLDLEFKPLSKGLGFHQKKYQYEAENLSFDEPDKMEEKSFSLKADLSAKKEKVDFAAPFESLIKAPKPIETPKISNDDENVTPVWSQQPSKTQNSWGGDVDLGLAPREDGIVDRDTFSQPLIIDNPFYIPQQKPHSPVEVVTLRFSGHDGLKKDRTKPVNPSLAAILMDVLTLISLCMIFSTLYFASTGQSLSEVILEMPYNSALKNQFIGLTLSIGFLYLIIARCFFGRTIGEWMYHLQLGSLRDQEKASYPLKVFIRTFVVFISGFVVFPLISYFLKKDFLVYFSGLELHGEKIKK